LLEVGMRSQGLFFTQVVRGAFGNLAPGRLYIVFFAGLAFGLADDTRAQPTGILVDGNAVVTGFSGVVPPVQIAPGIDPADKTLINRDGAVLRVIDLQAPGMPAGQLVTAPKPFTVRASQIGQVFGVALDDANPPNIYAAATSLDGLPITGPDVDGDGRPDRLRQGGPNAAFMSGLFGPGGGPGSVWRIDGATGAVAPFATVSLDGVANPGPALGGLAFDPISKTLLVADRATGMIHRFGRDGSERSRFDHGTQGRTAAGLPAVAHEPAQQLDITSPAFRPTDPATWRLAPPARRVFAVTVQQGRLYYSVAEEGQVWSVSLAPDGPFGTDARLEIAMPGGPAGSEITKIVFDDRGRMLLAERVAPSGAFDFTALTDTGGGRVLRFEPSTAGDRLWQPAASDPPGGLDPRASGNGGLAIGYGYDSAGRRNPASCGGTLWWTGEQLLPGGGNVVNGLEGWTEGAAAAWLVDFDDRLDDPQARGQMGDVAIFRVCAPAVAGGPPVPGVPAHPPGMPWPGDPGYPEEPMPSQEFGFGPGLDEFVIEQWVDWPPPPPPICPAGTHLENGLQCCPMGEIPGLTGACQSPCPNGSAVAGDPLDCWRGFQPNGAPGPGPTCWNGAPPLSLCAPDTFACKKCPKSPLKQCPAGWHLEIASPGNPPTPAWEWSDQHCTPNGPPCPGDEQRGADGLCHDMCPGAERAWPVNRCCLNGTQPDALGQCAPGILVPPIWYLDYLATGTGPCIPPNCSFYEFTVTGRQNFGRGSLTQRITVPPESNFPTARVTRGSQYCPASAWSCTKSGNVFTCSAEDCGLAAGDQVVVRLEGQAAPDITEPPPAPIERTSCGVLEWNARPGRGPATIAQTAEAIKALATQQALPTQQRTADGPATLRTTRRMQVCWTIRIVGKPPTPPTCPPNYAATADGQCCLRNQMTSGSVCCPSGQRPDARRAICVPVCTGDRIWTGTGCACPPGTIERRGECIRETVVPPVPPIVRTCGPDQTGVWPNCCPLGRYWNGRRCVPASTDACPPDSIGTQPNCRCRPPLVGKPGSCTRPTPCPLGTVGTPPDCRPVSCPRGMIGTPPDCRPAPCPEGMIGKPPNCRPAPCPAGMVGKPPNCRPATCPRGTTGTPPNCRPISCPRGMVGTPPNCQPAGCPRGTVGTPPNCRPIGCPRGMIGTPPNCRPWSQGGKPAGRDRPLDRSRGRITFPSREGFGLR
jgi:hypothetical protein